MGEIWMNVDTPTKKCTIHRKSCRFEREKKETLLKGIGHLKQDGGWIVFTTLRDAQNYFGREYSHKGYELSIECSCLGLVALLILG